MAERSGGGGKVGVSGTGNGLTTGGLRLRGSSFGNLSRRLGIAVLGAFIEGCEISVLEGMLLLI